MIGDESKNMGNSVGERYRELSEIKVMKLKKMAIFTNLFCITGLN